MATPYAFVTLVTSDSYLPGALALVAALKEVHPQPAVHPEVDFQTVCLVTPETVDISSIKLLRKSCDLVVGVEIIEQTDDKGLQLLGRLDLNIVLTKLHTFRLTQYSKIIFLDADVLPLRPLSHLFTLPHEFAAVPDVGWPDIFNSGVMVFSPGDDKFEELRALLKQKGSWDGGDQGILNEWRGSNWHRLSFVYNTTPTAAYTYAPAYERFGSQISAIHFIGPNKPWKSLATRAPGTKTAEKPELGPQQTYDYGSLLDRWFEVYDRHYRSTPHTSVSDFQVQRYISTWDKASNSGSGQPTMAPTPLPANAMGLEELKRVAMHGFSSSGRVSHRPEEGRYQSLPLDGRIDLMRPKKVEESEDSKGEDSQHAALYADAPAGPQDVPAETSGAESPAPVPMVMGARGNIGPTTYTFDHSTIPTARSYAPPSSRGQHAFSHEQVDFQAQPPPTQVLSAAPTIVTRHGLSPQSSPNLLQAQLQSPRPLQQPFQIPAQPNFYSNLHVQQTLAQSNSLSESSQAPQLSPHRQRSPVQSRSYVQSPSHSPQKFYHSLNDPHQSPRSHRRHFSRDPTHTPVNERENQDAAALQAQQPRHVHFKGGHRSPVAHFHPGPLQPPSPRTQRQHPDHHSGTISPPKVPWNPAVEPPPHVRPESVIPEDMYFPNIWDQAPSQQHDATFQSFSPPPTSPQTLRSEVFFHPPPPSTIPEQLILEGRYSNVLGPIDNGAKGDSPTVPTPDRNKVKTVFPWEEKPRHVPRRIFPATDGPLPSEQYIEEELAASPPKLSSVQQPERPSTRFSAHFPMVGVPTSLTSPNVWDTVPSIQRYASKLVRPKDVVAQLIPPPPENGWRKWEKMRERDWQERQDASSMDGDDEDDGDDDDDGDLSEAEGKDKAAKQRRGSSSSVSRMKKEYRVRGVQTESPEMVEEGVQVTILRAYSADGKVTSPPLLDENGIPSGSRGVGTDTRRDWPSLSSTATLLPPDAFHDVDPDPEQTARSPATTPRPLMPFPSMPSPTGPGSRSPETTSPRTYSPPTISSPPRVESPRVSFAPSVSVTRRASTSSSTISPLFYGSPRATFSPRFLGSPRTLSAGSLQKPGSPIASTVNRSQQTTPPSRQLPRLSSPFAPIQRSVSTETATTISPSTTHSSLITPDNTPVLGPRKTSRVWDPARGVEVFKRGSEEVLARFLRLGSFDEEAEKQPAT